MSAEEVVRRTVYGLTAVSRTAARTYVPVVDLLRTVVQDLGGILTDHDRRIAELERKVEAK